MAQVDKKFSIEEFIEVLGYAMYAKGFSTLEAMDCFGLVEMWHLYLHDIDIQDRGSFLGTPDDLAEGVSTMPRHWETINAPRDHSVALMKAPFEGRVVHAGHCGMIYRGNVYHIQEEGGFRVQSIREPKLVARIHDIVIHTDLK